MNHPYHGVLEQGPATRFQELFDHFTVGLAEVDPVGRIVLANPALCRMLGYSAEEFIGRTIGELIHPDDAEAAASRLDLAGHSNFEVRMRRKDGQSLWLFINGSPLAAPSGDVRSSAIVFIDITRRKQFEDSYRESEARYRTLFDSIDQGFLVLDMIYDEHGDVVDFRFIEANQAFGQMTNHPEVVGKRAREVSPNLESRWFEIYGNVARTGEPVRFELPVNSLDRWFDVYAFRITWNDRHHVAVLCNDITERRKIDEELKFQARLLDTVQQSVIATDPDGVVTYWNKVAEKRFGVPAEEAIGRSSVEITVGATGLPESQAREINEAMGRGESWFGELLGRSDTGEPYWSHAAVAPIQDEHGELIGIIGTSLDVTERKLAEDALRRSESRLRAVLAALPVGVWITDANRQLLETNPRADLIWAGNPEQLGTSDVPRRYLCWDPVTDEPVPYEDQPLGRVLATAEPVIGVELKISRFDGTIGMVLASAAPILDTDGEVIGGVNVFQDITELKQAETALRESEARNAFLLELNDTLRPLSDPTAIQGNAARLFGEFLAVNRVSYGEIEGSDLVFRRSYARDGAPVDGHPAFALLGKTLMTTSERGEPVAIDDVAADSRFTDAERATLEEAGIAAFAGVLVARDGRPVGALGVDHAAPWKWTAAERDLMREAADRIWSRSERARVQIALRESEERFRAVADLSPDGLLIWQKGCFVYANASAARIFGVDDPGELVGTDIFDFSPATDHARIRQRIQKVMAGVMVPPNEMQLIRPDGTNAFIDVSAGPVVWDGEPAIEVIWRDASERREAEMTLRESEARFHAIANLVPDLIWRGDRHGRREWFNQRWYEYTGQTPDIVRDGGWIDAIHPEDRLETREQYRRAVTTGQPLRHEHRIRRYDGEHHWFLVHAAPVRDESGAVAAWFGTATDIHEQRIARDALEERVAETTRELRALSRQLFRTQETERRHLARELHDEIGQELTGLSLTLATTRREHDDPRLEYASGIVDDLLDKVRKLSLDLRPSVLDDLGLLPAVLIHTEHFSAQTGIMVDVRHHGMDRRFPADVETAGYRVVQEALTNVARHSGTLSVTVHLVADTTLLVMIRDQGQGFDPDAALAAGVSSGLAGMRERITLISGEFSIESSPGAGAVVVAEIPLSGYNGREHGSGLIQEGELA